MPARKVIMSNRQGLINLRLQKAFPVAVKGEKLSKYAGKRIRNASVVIDSSDEEQIEIIRTQFSYLIFDADGRLDVVERGKKANLALNMLPPIYPESDGRQMIDARHKFARKRYDDQYKRQPLPALIANIEKAVFRG
jgi:hypothetical protein